MSASRLPGARKRPQAMADLISLAPTSSIEYILFSGLGSAVESGEIASRVEVLEQDKRRHTSTYRRIVIAYLQAELEHRAGFSLAFNAKENLPSQDI